MIKKTLTLFFLLTFTLLSFAQSPEAFKYQSVVRDSTGKLIPNKNVSFRISILKGSVSGTSEYIESHSVTTNELGLVTFEIGNGTPVSGSFSNINWSSDDFFIKIEIDPNGGSSFTFMGTGQFLSVPFALYAREAGNASNQTLSINGHDLTISDGNTITIPDDVDDADHDTTNEIQHIQKTGNTVSLSNNGGSFTDEVNDPDIDTTNEIQIISFTNDTIYLTEGGQLYLGDYLDNTDKQTLSLQNDSLSIDNGNTVYLEDMDTTNEIQTLSISGSYLSISGGNTVQLPGGTTGSSLPVGACIMTNDPNSPTGFSFTGDSLINGTDTWNYSSSDLPSARAMSACEIINSKLYVIGGANASNSFTSTVYEYDLVNDNWTTKASLSSALNGPISCVYNNKIYLFGGRFSNGSPSNQCQVYNPSTNSWSSISNMPTARFLGGAVVINNKIYVAGGSTGSGTVNKLEEYNPVNNTWTTKQPIPTNITLFAYCVYNNKLYLAGGVIGGAVFSKKLYVYNPVTNSWSQLSDMPVTRGSFSGELLNGDFYVFGGYNSSVAYSNNVYKYSFSTNSWSTSEDLLDACKQLSSANDGDKIYVVGGNTSVTTLDKIQVFTKAEIYYIHMKN